MEKKTYKDLKDGDIVYMVENADVFEELTVKIREEYYPRMIDEEEKELHYFLKLFHQDGTEYKYHWIQLVEKFKDATSTHDYDCFEYLWGSVCFFNRENAVEYYKKTVKDLIDIIDKKIEKIKNLEQQKCKYVEILKNLNSFE